jgi:transcription initiation factor TFIID subunit 11
MDDQIDEDDKDQVDFALSRTKSFTKEQERRYECYKRSTFKKKTMKTLLGHYTGSTTNSQMQQMTIVVSGITKMYVGELVENAKMVMEKWGESGPIQPVHLREAQRILEKQNKVPTKPKPKILL